MEESDSLHNSLTFSNDSTSICSSTDANKELYLSPPTELLSYRFESIYSSDEEPGPTNSANSSLLSETEYSGVSHVGNTDW